MKGKKTSKGRTVLLTMIIVVIFLRVFAGEVCSVPSDSMIPTIYAGDWLWIDKLTYGARLPRRFADIPIFNVFTWIKPLRLADEKNDWGYNRMRGFRMPRVGDLAVFESSDFPHPLLVKRIASILSTGDTIVVNAQNYDDSRMYGYIPYSSFVGRMKVVIFSIFSLNSEKDFIHAIRWGRFSKKMNCFALVRVQ